MRFCKNVQIIPDFFIPRAFALIFFRFSLDKRDGIGYAFFE